jgi:Ca-activated chloride channel family protein
MTLKIRGWGLAAALIATATLRAQQPPTFSGANRTVAVYATVTDEAGRLVPDLTRDQFQIDDNGRKQELTIFANEIQPITVVMLLDRSSSMRGNFELVEKAAEAFVEAMLPGDKARIGSFSDRIQVDPRDFTADHGELMNILRTELQFGGPTPLWNAVNVGITDLLHQQGRRVVLVFTDGRDAPMSSERNSSLKDVMKRAEEEDVMVYAIGFAGASGFGRRSGGYGGRPGGGAGGGHGGFGGGGFGGGRYGGGGSRGGQPDRPDEGLPKIATATGGGYFELTSTSDLASTFARVAEELHHQYALGFTPAKLDGKMHTLDVRVAQPGLTARARKSYLATTPRS